MFMRRIWTAFLLALIAQLALAQKFTISGYITNYDSGESLIGAGVVLDNPDQTGSRVGAVSNNFGFYILSLPAGLQSVTWSFIGHTSHKETLDLRRDTTINIRLMPSAAIKEAIVTARREAGFNSSNTGAMELSQDILETVPALFGEKDVLKALQYLPGVQSGMSGTSGIYVRGGGPDENLILLDDIPVYSVSHLLGIFSVFTPEAVKKVTLFKGSFPARYGGRLSSVIDVRTNDGNMNETHGLISVGLLSDRIHLEGPIVRDKTSYSVSGRVLHTFLFTPLLLLKGVPANYYFGDFNAKITHRFDNNDRLIASAYHGRDRFLMHSGEVHHPDRHTESSEYNDLNLDWGNTIGSLRWNHAFGSKLFANTTLAYNHYETDIDIISSSAHKSPEYEGSSKKTVTYGSGINDFDLKIDFDYNPVPEHIVKFGAEYLHHRFNPQEASIKENQVVGKETVKDTLINGASGNTLIGHEASVYLEDDFVLGKRLSFNPGLRLSIFNTQGKTYASLQPRFSGRLYIGGGVSVKTSYSRMSQYVHLLTTTDISLPTDLWVPITKDIKPETADQWSFGTYWDAGHGWEFSLEGYYKSMNNILEYKDGMSLLLTTTGWEEKVAMGKGRAYGMELLVKKNTGNTTGWLGYTLAKSERIFPDGSINRGEWFPYKYDRRHNVSLVVNHKFSDRIDFAGSWQFYTGGVATFSTRRVIALDINQNIKNMKYVSSRGNYRLPPSHTLNVGFNFHKKMRRGERVWNISLYNAYNSMNPDFVYEKSAVEYRHGSVWKKGIEISKVTVLPILPSFSYTRSF